MPAPMTEGLPHEHVYAQLGVSPISGVGVFAIAMIPEGTDLFPNDPLGIRWVDARLIADIADPSQRKLYEDFAIRRGSQLGCPRDFNSMTVGWYLNEPAEGQQANVRVEADYRFIAQRAIAAGEELTVRYADFSDASAPD